MRKRNLLTFIKEERWAIFMCLCLGLCYWLMFVHKATYYKYTVKVTFCDNRPSRIVDHYSMRRPGIDNRRNGRNGEIVTTFEFQTKDGTVYTLLNVCEINTLSQASLGEYSLFSNPF